MYCTQAGDHKHHVSTTWQSQSFLDAPSFETLEPFRLRHRKTERYCWCQSDTVTAWFNLLVWSLHDSQQAGTAVSTKLHYKSSRQTNCVCNGTGPWCAIQIPAQVRRGTSEYSCFGHGWGRVVTAEASYIYFTAETARFRRCVHHGCFDDNDSEPTALLDDMHQQRITWIKHHIKKATVLTSQAKSSKQTMPDEEQLVGWFSWGTPGYAADEKDSKCFYDNLKKAYGPRDVHSALIRSKDGATLCTNQSDILQRWAEHFNSMLTSNLPSITLC